MPQHLRGVSGRSAVQGIAVLGKPSNDVSQFVPRKGLLPLPGPFTVLLTAFAVGLDPGIVIQMHVGRLR
jgi:hypothetical protein